MFVCIIFCKRKTEYELGISDWSSDVCSSDLGLVEQVEFQLRGEEGLKAMGVEERDLAAQHGARRVRHRIVVMVQHVAEHRGGALQPGRQPERREVGLQQVVAVALLPARRGVARHQLHVDVVGQQVVAGVGGVLGGIDEELGLEALEIGKHTSELPSLMRNSYAV